MARKVKIGSLEIGQDEGLFIIAGPCVIESRASTLRHALKLKSLSEAMGLPLIFKSSYDKANRTSLRSFRGPGIEEGLDILRAVKEELGLPVLSDVHAVTEVEKAARVLDVLQIPAFLSRQTDLLLAAAETQKPVNVKKGQFMSPHEMSHVVEKIRSTGNENILLTERGFSFGYNALVSDFRSIVIMREWGYPVVFDATHSVQSPGGMGYASGGDRRYVPALAQAAVAAGADGLFMEVHENPAQAMSDGLTMVPLDELEPLWIRIKKIAAVTRDAQKVASPS